MTRNELVLLVLQVTGFHVVDYDSSGPTYWITSHGTTGPEDVIDGADRLHRFLCHHGIRIVPVNNTETGGVTIKGIYDPARGEDENERIVMTGLTDEMLPHELQILAASIQS